MDDDVNLIKNTKVVLMAGGLGERLRPLTNLLPKSLLPIGDTTILDCILKHLNQNGLEEVIIATNYRADMIMTHVRDGSQYGLKVTYSKEDKALGTAGPLALLKGILTDTFMVINSDILTNANLRNIIKFHKYNNAIATAVTKKMIIPLQYGVVNHDKEKIIEIQEKPNIEVEILAGMYVLDSSVLSSIPGGFYQMPDLLKELINRNERVICHQLNEYWLDIGILENYDKAKEDFQKKIIKI